MLMLNEGFKRHVDVVLRDIVNDGLDSAGLVVGIDDLEGLFLPK